MFLKLFWYSFRLYKALANNENVTMEVMAKICSALDCKIDDVVEILPDEK